MNGSPETSVCAENSEEWLLQGAFGMGEVCSSTCQETSALVWNLASESNLLTFDLHPEVMTMGPEKSPHINPPEGGGSPGPQPLGYSSFPAPNFQES